MGSRLISWAAKFEGLDIEKRPSHVAVLVDNIWVIESTMTTGVRIIPYWRWRELNEQLYKIQYSEVFIDSRSVLSRLLTVWGRGYDWVGILYFAYRYLRLIVFRDKLPRRNRLQDRNRYFCTEFISTLTGEDLSMKSPAKICNDWMTYERPK